MFFLFLWNPFNYLIFQSLWEMQSNVNDEKKALFVSERKILRTFRKYENVERERESERKTRNCDGVCAFIFQFLDLQHSKQRNVFS